MTMDKDRDIVAIRYNLLNLPDLIQFRNGSQIVNTYDASGKKLGTEYFTQNTVIEPISDGQVISQHFILNSVEQNGTIYADNKEYTTLNGDPAQTSLSKLYNSEGYVTDLSNPQYYYYRRDHLGDNREVWRANDKATVQYTQYYPSGLPMASNVGDNPGLQERKYNGKEFVEMHGYDTYDIVWRQYYPAIARFQTPDPYAEKYYSLSPYTICAGNMVRYTDPDGRYLVDSNNKKITFDQKSGWSKNVTNDVQEFGDAMMTTTEGSAVLTDMMTAPYPISIKIEDGVNLDKPSNLGHTTPIIKATKVEKVDVVIYKGAIKKEVEKYKKVSEGKAEFVNPTDKTKLLQKLAVNFKQLFIAVGVHEGTHSTKTEAMSGYKGNNTKTVTTEEAEKKADSQEIKVIKEMNDKK